MSKAVKWILIIAGCVCGVGILFCAVGYMLGGNKGFQVNMVDGKIFSDGEADELISGTIDINEFDELDLEIGSIDFNMVEGSEYKIEYRCKKSNKPEVSQNGKKLAVKQPDDFGIYFSFGDFGNNEEYVNLTVPSGSEIYKLSGYISSGNSSFENINLKGEITLSSGDLIINGSKAGEDMLVKLNSGDAFIEDCEFDDLETKVSSGGMHLTDVTAAAINHTASSGSCRLEDVSASRIRSHQSSGDFVGKEVKVDELVAELSSGDFDVEIIGDASDYKLVVDRSSGDVEIDGKEYEDGGTYNESGSKLLSIDISSGDASVRFS